MRVQSSKAGKGNSKASSSQQQQQQQQQHLQQQSKNTVTNTKQENDEDGMTILERFIEGFVVVLVAVVVGSACSLIDAHVHTADTVHLFLPPHTHTHALLAI